MLFLIASIVFCLFVFPPPEKYVFVGKLLKPGEQPTDYTDSEEDDKTEADKKTD